MNLHNLNYKKTLSKNTPQYPQAGQAAVHSTYAIRGEGGGSAIVLRLYCMLEVGGGNCMQLKYVLCTRPHGANFGFD